MTTDTSSSAADPVPPRRLVRVGRDDVAAARAQKEVLERLGRPVPLAVEKIAAVRLRSDSR